MARANFAAALVEGRGVGLPGPIDARAIVAGAGAVGGREAGYALLLGIDRPGRFGPAEEETPEAARRALAAVLASPEAQLG